MRNLLLTLLRISCIWRVDSVTAFKVFFSSWIFNNLIIMWPSVDLFVFILLESVELLKCVHLCLLSNLGYFQPLFL